MAWNTQNLKERCVFVLNALGLSISQLLGQNNPNPSESIPSPLQLFRSFVEHHGLSPRLIVRFERFNYFYNGCRHFGKSTSGRGYKGVDDLSFEVAEECYGFGLAVWAIVIDIFRSGSGSDLKDFDLDYVLDGW